MCGRIALKVRDPFGQEVFHDAPRNLETYFGLDIRPTQNIVCMTGQGIEPRTWGWRRDWLGSKPLINATHEKLGGFFADSAASADNRCAVPVTAWYEWTGEKGSKQQWRFTWSNQEIFFLAGLLDTIGSEVTLVTRAAPEALQSFHHRAPCVLSHEAAQGWIRGGDLPFSEGGYLAGKYGPDPEQGILL